MHRSLRRSVAAGIGATLVLASVAGTQLARPTTHPAAALAAGATTDWPSFGGNTDNTRYAQLTQVNPSNVSKLGVAWTAAEGKNISEWQTAPVVVNGVMYFTTNTDQVRAVDAATGKLRWQYTPKVDFYKSVAGGGGGVAVNRGVTVVDGSVFLLTFDARLIKLQASTGEKLWESNVADPNAGYSESSPATYWNGMLFVGSEEGDAGQRGFEAAFDAKTGKKLWTFYTVPAPGHGWMPAKGSHGGGDVWMPSVIDPSTGMLYIGTGNPSPDFVNTQRPGCNQWANAVVALNAKTGKLVWGHTEFCNDVWDYDSDPSPMLFNMSVHGQMTRVLGHGNKAGKYFIYEAKTGTVLAQTTYLGGFSIPHLKPTAAGVKVCPGDLGGIEFGPPSYSPINQAVYQGYINECQTFKTISVTDINGHHVGQVDSGGSSAPAGPITGGVVGIDAHTGKLLWKHALDKSVGGGTLATSSGLVFSGADDGYFYALDAKNGKTLWKTNIGIGFGAPPMAYSVNGTEYIAIAAGGAGATAASGGNLGGTLMVFKLNGSPIKKAPAVTNGSAVPVSLPSLKGYTQVNRFMWANAAAHHVVVQVIAAQTSANAGFNFDGYYNGAATFTVPAHWSVDLEFKNLAALPHSAAITAGHTVPAALVTFGFAPALTPNAAVGTVSKAWQLVGFTADHAGKFSLSCLVPGHLPSGMWDWFEISSTATMPSLSTTGG